MPKRGFPLAMDRFENLIVPGETSISGMLLASNLKEPIAYAKVSGTLDVLSFLKVEASLKEFKAQIK